MNERLLKVMLNVESELSKEEVKLDGEYSDWAVSQPSFFDLGEQVSPVQTNSNYESRKNILNRIRTKVIGSLAVIRSYDGKTLPFSSALSAVEREATFLLAEINNYRAVEGQLRLM